MTFLGSVKILGNSHSLEMIQIVAPSLWYRSQATFGVGFELHFPISPDEFPSVFFITHTVCSAPVRCGHAGLLLMNRRASSVTSVPCPERPIPDPHPLVVWSQHYTINVVQSPLCVCVFQARSFSYCIFTNNPSYMWSFRYAHARMFCTWWTPIFHASTLQCHVATDAHAVTTATHAEMLVMSRHTNPIWALANKTVRPVRLTDVAEWKINGVSLPSEWSPKNLSDGALEMELQCFHLHSLYIGNYDNISLEMLPTFQQVFECCPHSRGTIRCPEPWIRKMIDPINLSQGSKRNTVLQANSFIHLGRMEGSLKLAQQAQLAGRGWWSSRQRCLLFVEITGTTCR